MVQRITETIKIPLQLGGGMRSEAAIEQALLAGAARVVIGTRAAESLDFVADAVLRFGGEKLAVGIDARDGLVAVRGWTEATSLQAEDLAKQVAALGVAAVIYTDIATDGMLQGPNVLAMEKLVAGTDCAVIASGGVSSAEDLVRLEKIDNLSGTIIGKALFDGLIAGNLREAMAGNSK